MISIAFTYKSRTYYALIRAKIIGEEKYYHITVMNGDLETLLYGHHIIIEENGVLKSPEMVNSEVAELKQSIIDAFSQYLKENDLLSNEKMIATATI